MKFYTYLIFIAYFNVLCSIVSLGTSYQLPVL